MPRNKKNKTAKIPTQEVSEPAKKIEQPDSSNVIESKTNLEVVEDQTQDTSILNKDESETKSQEYLIQPTHTQNDVEANTNLEVVKKQTQDNSDENKDKSETEPQESLVQPIPTQNDVELDPALHMESDDEEFIDVTENQSDLDEDYLYDEQDSKLSESQKELVSDAAHANVRDSEAVIDKLESIIQSKHILSNSKNEQPNWALMDVIPSELRDYIVNSTDSQSKIDALMQTVKNSGIKFGTSKLSDVANNPLSNLHILGFLFGLTGLVPCVAIESSKQLCKMAAEIYSNYHIKRKESELEAARQAAVQKIGSNDQDEDCSYDLIYRDLGIEELIKEAYSHASDTSAKVIGDSPYIN